MTLTKEWLLKTIAELEEERDAIPEAVNEDAPMALAAMKMALASLTAEPVAWMVRDIDTGEKVIRPDRSYFEGSCQPLYTAPPAPVFVPDGLRLALSNAGIAAPESDEMLAATCEKHIQILVNWVKERKPFQPSPVVPEALPCPVMLEPGLRFGKGVRTKTMLDALQRRAEYCAELEAMTPEQRSDHDAGMKEFRTMLQGGKS